MSEPTKQTNQSQQQIVYLPLGELHPSLTNRPERSGFDDKSIAELAESIRGPGIIEPLIVRPLPASMVATRQGRGKGGYELVCGERRWTAAKLLKLENAPCIVRHLDDNAARKIQIIENLQREGLHPVEEAKGYADLLAQKDAKGKPLHTIESLANEIGKSAAFVYGRLTLLKMPKIALEASFIDKLNASNALLIARIPNPTQALKATLELLDPFGQGDGPEREKRALDPENDPMSYRKAKQHIQENYMVRLKGSPFDQEAGDLLAVEITGGERSAGGKCSDCPFRTGNMKALFPDVDSLDVCTQTDCFKRKKDAAWRKANERAKAQGHTLLRDGKAAQLFKAGQLVPWQSEYVDVRQTFPGDKKKTWEQVLGEHLPDSLVQARDDSRRVHFLIPVATALDAAKKAGRTPPKEFTHQVDANGHSRPDPEELRRQEAQRRKQVERTELIAASLGQLVLAKAENAPTNNWWRWMLSRLVDGREHECAARFGCKTGEDLATLIDKAPEAKCRAMMVALVALEPMVDYQGQLSDELLDACEFYKLDHKKVIAEKQAQFKAADKVERENAQATPAAAKAEPKAEKAAK